jgi:hypothetical protein
MIISRLTSLNQDIWICLRAMAVCDSQHNILLKVECSIRSESLRIFHFEGLSK